MPANRSRAAGFVAEPRRARFELDALRVETRLSVRKRRGAWTVTDLFSGEVGRL